MRGSLILNFTKTAEVPPMYVDITINSVIQDRVYTNSNNLYTFPLNVGDTVTLTFTDPSGQLFKYLSLLRRDYTTNGFYTNGINDVQIVHNTKFTTYTFVAVPGSNSYNFHYYVSVDNICCFPANPANFSTYYNTEVFNIFPLLDGTLMIQSNNNDSTYQGTTIYGTIRIDECGNLLNNFNISSPQLGGNQICYQGSKIIVGNGSHIVRLNTDYSYDSSFYSGKTALNDADGNHYISSTTTLADNSILIAGNFVNYVNQFGTYSGLTGFVCLYSGGTVNTGLTYNIVASGKLPKFFKDKDGKILIYEFDTINGNAYGGILRLNSNGTIDNTFTSAATTSPFSIGQQSDGKYIIGIGGTNEVKRLTNSGTIDSTFGFVPVGSEQINSIYVQSNDKFFIAGGINNSSPSYQGLVARYNSNGTIDNTFYSGQTSNSGINDLEHWITEDTNGNIWIGGSFTKYNGISTGKLIRIDNNGSYNFC